MYKKEESDMYVFAHRLYLTSNHFVSCKNQLLLMTRAKPNFKQRRRANFWNLRFAFLHTAIEQLRPRNEYVENLQCWENQFKVGVNFRQRYKN